VAGYAASARLQGAEPQFAFTNDHGYRSVFRGAQDAPAAPDGGIIEQLELVGQPINEIIGEWLGSVGESWSQMTFFLFDPESWR
jgi:hypothetical protein